MILAFLEQGAHVGCTAERLHHRLGDIQVVPTGNPSSVHRLHDFHPQSAASHLSRLKKGNPNYNKHSKKGRNLPSWFKIQKSKNSIIRRRRQRRQHQQQKQQQDAPGRQIYVQSVKVSITAVKYTQHEYRSISKLTPCPNRKRNADKPFVVERPTKNRNIVSGKIKISFTSHPPHTSVTPASPCIALCVQAWVYLSPRTPHDENTKPNRLYVRLVHQDTTCMTHEPRLIPNPHLRRFPTHTKTPHPPDCSELKCRHHRKIYHISQKKGTAAAHIRSNRFVDQARTRECESKDTP